VCGTVNRHNCCIWGSENPQDVTGHEDDSIKANEQGTLMKNTALYHVPVGTVFQLNGAPPHLSHCVRAFLDRQFPGCHIGRGGTHYLAPSFSGFFILGVCNIVYHENVQNANKLHDRIVRAAKCITSEMLSNIW
jgi:hypothetical protein